MWLHPFTNDTLISETSPVECQYCRWSLTISWNLKCKAYQIRLLWLVYLSWTQTRCWTGTWKGSYLYFIATHRPSELFNSSNIVSFWDLCDILICLYELEIGLCNVTFCLSWGRLWQVYVDRWLDVGNGGIIGEAELILELEFG